MKVDFPFSPASILCLGAAAVSALGACERQEAPEEAAAYAVEGVTVLPMDGEERRLEDRTVVVEGDRITAMGPAEDVEVPEAARTISGHGRHLIPGLAEMHAHLPGEDAEAQWVDDVLFLYLANGVTTVRSMLGAPNHLELREEVETGQRHGPTILSASPALSGGAVDGPEDARRQVREYAGAGHDLLKTHWGLTREEWDALAEEAHAEGISFGGHIPREVGLEHALESGISTVEHLDGYLNALAPPETRERLRQGEDRSMAERVRAADRDRIDEWARATAEAEVWNAPTLHLWENLWGPVDLEAAVERPEMAYMPPERVQGWAEAKEERGAEDPPVADALAEIRREILQALQDAGADILLAVDTPQMFTVPGFAAHREMAVMEEAGLTEREILRAGTRNVARYARDELGTAGDFGVVAEGRRADLVLLEADPLENLDNLRDVAGVMVRGRWMDRRTIREGLREIRERHAEEGDEAAGGLP